MEKTLVIVDTDCGTDDAAALLLACRLHKCNPDSVQILAITCCPGNATVDQVVVNVSLTLREAGVSSIPVHRGCETSLLDIQTNDELYNLEDGFGNGTKRLPAIEAKVEDEQAVQTLLRLTALHPQQVDILCLGPLTNIAAAQLLDSSFSSRVKRIVTMGGSAIGLGNCEAAGEFNYWYDPESVHVVLTKAACPLLALPWETCVDYRLSREKDMYASPPSKRLEFIKRIHEEIFSLHPGDVWISPDFLAACALFYPQVVTGTSAYPTRMELTGTLSRGQLVVDRRAPQYQTPAKMVEFITAMDSELIRKCMLDVLADW